MKSAVIAVGSELLLGAVVNSNAAFISDQLNDLGIDVAVHYSINDDPAVMTEILKAAEAMCDLIICTGGLGPTEDDLTRETVCGYLDVPLVFDDSVDRHINKYFEDIGQRATVNNEKQKYVPEGAEIFLNHGGTAPGFAIEKNGITVICVPGVPREMKLMFTDSVRPYLMRRINSYIVSNAVELFGIGESVVETKLIDIIDEGADPVVATYAKEAVVEVRITSKRDSQEEATAAVEKMTERVLERVGRYSFSRKGEMPIESAAEMIAEREISVSCAEISTGGRLSAVLGSSRLISDLFECGNVLSNIGALKKEPSLLDASYGGNIKYETELTDHIAEKLYEKTGSDMCLAAAADVTADLSGISAGRVFLSVLYNGKMYTDQKEYSAWTPELIKDYSAQAMLVFIIKILNNEA